VASNSLLGQLVNLLVNLILAWLVWRYYTPRTFAVEKRYSTLGPRFWSGIVDSCVLWPIGFLCWLSLSHTVSPLVAAGIITVEALAWLVYTIVMHARFGQTVGKRVTKVRVVDFRTEGPISWWQACLRESIAAVLTLTLLGYEIFALLTGNATAQNFRSGALATWNPFGLLLWLPLLWFCAEVVTMITNEKRRALHDFIAGTVVVRTHAA
jgi:uncharacterized RDD family membrane protein YckC